MISAAGLVVLIIVEISILAFIISMRLKRNDQLLQKLYYCMAYIALIWDAALIALFFFDWSDRTAQYIIDSITNIAMFFPVFTLCIAMTIFYGWNKLPSWCGLLFFEPMISWGMVWTNPLHHHYYAHFSLISGEVVFGWYFYVHLLYTFICLTASIIFIIMVAKRNISSILRWQAVFFTIGCLFPSVVNIGSVVGVIPATTVINFLSVITGMLLFHGIAIFKFHLLDIKPLAMQTVLNRISDGYLILDLNGLVIDINRAFADVFGREYGITINCQLEKCSPTNPDAQTGFFTLIGHIENCRSQNVSITYEHSIILRTAAAFVKKYYLVDITPLYFGKEDNIGCVVMFKDITIIKESMEELQQNQMRMMQQERLASLGQMVGGLAHNLKTPIMSIAGGVSSIENLITESESSTGDPDVTNEDFLEIYLEMHDWTQRIREACAYMSDIISTVKEQASSMEAEYNVPFIFEDIVRRTEMLLRHELLQTNCKLEYSNTVGPFIITQGDINSMVQVVTNLVDNAAYSMKDNGGGTIRMVTSLVDDNLAIKIIDTGIGIPEEVKKKVFQSMITTKGSSGSGIGLYISKLILEAKFNARIEYEDNPGGGTIFTVTIPSEHFRIN